MGEILVRLRLGLFNAFDSKGCDCWSCVKSLQARGSPCCCTTRQDPRRLTQRLYAGKCQIRDFLRAAWRPIWDFCTLPLRRIPGNGTFRHITSNNIAIFPKFSLPLARYCMWYIQLAPTYHITMRMTKKYYNPPTTTQS